MNDQASNPAEKELTPEEAARQQLKAIYDDGFAEINGREYYFSQMTHSQRRKIFAFYSTVTHLVKAQNFGFLTSPEFAEVEKLILAKVLVDDIQLSKSDGHFDRFPQDYLLFVTTALGVISYPFFQGNSTS
jgi:hypothetical protein